MTEPTRRLIREPIAMFKPTYTHATMNHMQPITITTTITCACGWTRTGSNPDELHTLFADHRCFDGWTLDLEKIPTLDSHLEREGGSKPWSSDRS